MTTQYSSPAAAIEAGPARLTLAAYLGALRIELIVTEGRAFKEPPSGNCNHVLAARCRSSAALASCEARLIGNPLKRGTERNSTASTGRAIRDILGIADRFRYEVISAGLRGGLFDKMRVGLVCLVGDAAYLWTKACRCSCSMYRETPRRKFMRTI